MLSITSAENRLNGIRTNQQIFRQNSELNKRWYNAPSPGYYPGKNYEP